MASISGTETKPEVLVRRFLFKHGFRFRKNLKTLPGKPDIVLTRYQTIIFINGCFWHGHSSCRKGTIPLSNIDFWTKKITNTVVRDKKIKHDLKKEGWRVITIWECKLKNKKIFDATMNKLIISINKTAGI